MTDTRMNQRRDYGLVGEFPGDNELLEEVTWCADAYGLDHSAPKPAPALTRLVTLLGKLPLKGRQAVVRNILEKSPHRDAVLRDLFDYCFQAGDGVDDVPTTDTETKSDSEHEEDEFVVIAYPRASSTEEQQSQQAVLKPLNLSKFHIFQTVLVLMAVSGKAGADSSRRYLNETASTRYRAKVLIQAATCFSEADFSNQELYDYYKASSQTVQTNLVNACCQLRNMKNGKKSSRVEFLRLVYESDGAKQNYPNLIYYLDSDYLEGQLDALMQQPNDEGDWSISSPFVLQHWGRHGDVYLDYIRRRMQDCHQDQLQLGEIWTFSQISKSMQPRHVYALLDLLQEHTVCRIKSSLSSDVLKYLQGRSAKGEDVSQFDEVCRVVMVPEDFLGRLTQKERLALATKYIEARDSEMFKGLTGVCPRHELPYQSFFVSLSLEDFWMLVLKEKSDDFWSFFSSPEMAKSIPLGPERSWFLQAWAELHNRCTPSNLTAEQISTWFQGQEMRQLWSAWFQSQSKFYTFDRYSNNVIAAEALSFFGSGQCLELPDLNPKVKAYAKLVNDLLKTASMAFDKVSSHLAPNVSLEPILGLLNKMDYSKLSMLEVESVKSLSETCIQVSWCANIGNGSHFIVILEMFI